MPNKVGVTIGKLPKQEQVSIKIHEGFRNVLAQLATRLNMKQCEIVENLIVMCAGDDELKERVKKA